MFGKSWQRFMKGFVVLINQALRWPMGYSDNCERLHRSCQEVSWMPNPWWHYTPTPKSVTSDDRILAIWMLGYGSNWAYRSAIVSWTSLHLSSDRLLFKMGRSCTIERSHLWASHSFLCQQYCLGVPRRILSDNGPAFQIYRFVDRHKIDWRYSSI